MMIKFLISLSFLAPFHTFAQPETVTEVIYRVNENAQDSRYNYDYEVLKLALEKTKKQYGDYKLTPSSPMNFTRALYELKQGALKNFFFKHSFDDTEFINPNISYARFPVDLGIVGNRVCFTNKKVQNDLDKINQASDLKKFTFILGSSWVDVKILRKAGLNVVEKPNYKSLFLLTANKRADLFCRGANEILAEYKAYRNLQGIALDQQLLIYYDLPRFFYGNAKFLKVLKRIEEGLKIAHKDGSLISIWKKEYLESVIFSKLNTRKKIYLQNEFIKKIDFDYHKYFINIAELK